MARVAVVVLVFRLERVDLVRASVGVGRPEPVADRGLVQIRAEVHVNAALRRDRLRRPRRFQHDEVVDRAGAEVRGIARQVVVVIALARVVPPFLQLERFDRRAGLEAESVARLVHAHEAAFIRGEVRPAGARVVRRGEAVVLHTCVGGARHVRVVPHIVGQGRDEEQDGGAGADAAPAKLDVPHGWMDGWGSLRVTSACLRFWQCSIDVFQVRLIASSQRPKIRAIWLKPCEPRRLQSGGAARRPARVEKARRNWRSAPTSSNARRSSAALLRQACA